jgi:hypothetical protein
VILHGRRMWSIKSTRRGEAVSVYPDDADPNLFWYLPPSVEFVKQDGRTKFTLIKYRPAKASQESKGGGFLIFDVSLKLDPSIETKIKTTLRRATKQPDKLNLVPVPFESGTVKCVALDLEGGGGTRATLVAGTIQAVERISGATNAALGGDNVATFSLKLSQEGVVILEKAFRDATTPVGIIYDLEYRAMRPNLSVKITADMSRVYNHFSASLKGQYAMVSGGIDAGIETLKKDGSITINVINYIDEKDKKQKEEWAINFFKAELLDKFFTPTLDPDGMSQRMAQADPLDQVIDRATGARPADTTTPEEEEEEEEGGEDSSSGNGGEEEDAELEESNEEETENEEEEEPKDKEKVESEGGKGDPEGKPDKEPDGEPEGTEPEGGGKEKGENGSEPDGSTEGTGGKTEGKRGEKENGGTDTVAAKPKDEKPKAGKGTAPLGISPKAVTNALVSSATGMPAISFQLKAMRQVETGKLEFHYDRSAATMRQYRPMGSIGLLFEDLKKDPESSNLDPDSQLPVKYFVSVDLDHPFYRHFPVSVETISKSNFDKWGLRSAIATIDYGSNPKNSKQEDLVFTKKDREPKKFEAFLSQTLDLQYRRAFTFNFEPGTDWVGKRNTYRIPADGTETSREGTIYLDPTRFVQFLEISVNTSQMVWDGISSADLHLEYKDSDGWNPKKVFYLTSSSTNTSTTSSSRPGELTWKLRLTHPEEQTYTYRVIYRLPGGSTQEEGPIKTDIPTVVLRDPFSSRRLTVKVQPNKISWEQVDSIQVTLKYADPENKIQEETDFAFDTDHKTPQSWTILLKDPNKKVYQWQAEYFMADGSSIMKSWTTYQGKILRVGMPQ